MNIIFKKCPQINRTAHKELRNCVGGGFYSSSSSTNLCELDIEYSKNHIYIGLKRKVNT